MSSKTDDSLEPQIRVPPLTAGYDKSLKPDGYLVMELIKSNGSVLFDIDGNRLAVVVVAEQDPWEEGGSMFKCQTWTWRAKLVCDRKRSLLESNGESGVSSALSVLLGKISSMLFEKGI
ncbi:hypothetical protein TWF718_005400 [Orbilia javanica]|uniref:Uncharacterized protein n=1 Tax=Orbilia javanica TaxID=47235 RepID=A0AAN8RNW2_9PEZI